MRVLFLESHPMWIYSVPNGFRDAGHEVRVSGALTEENLPILIEEFKPQIIIMLGWTSEHIGPKRKWIKKYVHNANVPLVYWATEDPIHTDKFSLPFIKQVGANFVFTVADSLVEFYHKNGFAAAYMDFGYHPDVHKRCGKDSLYSCEIAVVANAYPGLYQIDPNFYRFQSVKTLILPLIKEGVRVDFWGWGWKELMVMFGYTLPNEWVHGYLDYTQAYKVYNSANIVLGIQNLPSQVTQRTYEILGSGGFLLTSDTPSVNKLFISGQHLVTAKEETDTCELVNFYLNQADLRKQISYKGQEAVAVHSYKERAIYMIETLRKEKII